MKRISIILIGIVLVCSGIIFAQATNPKEKGQALKPEKSERPIGKPNLTDEQKTKLKELNRNFRKESIDIREKIMDARESLVKLMKEKNPNEIAVNQKIDEINSLNLNLKKMGMKVELEKRKIYTDEQWENIKKARRLFTLRKRIPGGGYGMMNPFTRRGFSPESQMFNRGNYQRGERWNQERPLMPRQRMIRPRMQQPWMLNPEFGLDESESENFSPEDFSMLLPFDEEGIILPDDELFFEEDIPFDDYIIEEE